LRDAVARKHLSGGCEKKGPHIATAVDGANRNDVPVSDANRVNPVSEFAMRLGEVPLEERQRVHAGAVREHVVECRRAARMDQRRHSVCIFRSRLSKLNFHSLERPSVQGKHTSMREK
jgi:hypothetical protein